MQADLPPRLHLCHLLLFPNLAHYRSKTQYFLWLGHQHRKNFSLTFCHSMSTPAHLSWWMDGWWVRMMSHCFGSPSSTGKMYMYHGAEWWLRLPKSRQSWTCLIQDWAESGQNALTKNGWEISRKEKEVGKVLEQGTKASVVFSWITWGVEMNRWIGEKDNFRRARCSTQDFCSHVSRRVRFRVQGRPLFPIFTAAKPLSTLEWMVTMLWVQRVECRVTPTNCAIPFTAAPNT